MGKGPRKHLKRSVTPLNVQKNMEGLKTHENIQERIEQKRADKLLEIIKMKKATRDAEEINESNQKFMINVRLAILEYMEANHVKLVQGVNGKLEFQPDLSGEDSSTME